MVCSLCELIHFDKTRHILCDCLVTDSNREEFFSNVSSTFGDLVATELKRIDADSFLLIILGASQDIVDGAVYPDFIMYSFAFIVTTLRKYYETYSVLLG